MEEDKTRLEYEDDNNKKSFQKVYGWFIVVNKLSGNDYTKHKIVYESNVVEVLNQLSFLINYEEEQERLILQSRNS